MHTLFGLESTECGLRIWTPLASVLVTTLIAVLMKIIRKSRLGSKTLVFIMIPTTFNWISSLRFWGMVDDLSQLLECSALRAMTSGSIINAWVIATSGTLRWSRICMLLTLIPDAIGMICLALGVVVGIWPYIWVPVMLLLALACLCGLYICILCEMDLMDDPEVDASDTYGSDIIWRLAGPMLVITMMCGWSGLHLLGLLDHSSGYLGTLSENWTGRSEVNDLLGMNWIDIISFL
jgi:hypothetical protein